MNLTLPKSVIVDGKELKIRYDYRVIIDILVMMNDPDISASDKSICLLAMFYEDPREISDYESAIKACYEFIDGGSCSRDSGPRIVNWEQDAEYIIAPINRVIGHDVRAVEYDYKNNTGGLHWWTFLSAYMEIGGDCLFSQILSIRSKKARGKPLEKYEREWYSQNRSIVEIRRTITESEKKLIDHWTGGVVNG